VRLLRVVLAIGLLAAGFRAAQQLVAVELIESGNVVALDIAQRWDPDQPEIYFRRALLRRDSVESYDLDAACGDFSTAAELNPFNWLYHLELARCREMQNDITAAEHSFLKALALNPRSGTDHWSLAHFYLRHDRSGESIDHIRQALRYDSSLEAAALPVLDQLGVGPERLIEIWPVNGSSRNRLLAHLLSVESTAIVSKTVWTLWRQLLDSSSPPTLWQASPMLRWLLEHDTDSARSEWAQLARVNGLFDPAFTGGNNLVWNGSFQLQATGALLDWRLVSPAGSAGASMPGGLRFEFDGTTNLSGVLLEQLVVVPPGAALRLTFTAEADSISTDEGPRLQVAGVSGGRPLASPVHFLGTATARQYRLDFMAPETGLIRVQMVRTRSLRIDNRLGGVLRLSDVCLQLAKGALNEDLPHLSDR